MNLKQKLNNVFKTNPNFIFYDYDNECIGKDLLDFISDLLKEAQKSKIIAIEKKMLKDKSFIDELVELRVKAERDKIKKDLLRIADKGELEQLRLEVINYFKNQ
uniref:Uncharacterized protein n=1 Tax=viral metagenome TaxID=1070528 RepID=A0A6M3LQ85_9ZZZZ